MTKYYDFYHCTSCEQFFNEKEIVLIQNTRSITRSWRECPVCGSKVLPVVDKDFDGQEMMEDLFHRTVS
jgi:DNA-directed RNA polymerase subunit RPC12/RpoP